MLPRLSVGVDRRRSTFVPPLLAVLALLLLGNGAAVARQHHRLQAAGVVQTPAPAARAAVQVAARVDAPSAAASPAALAQPQSEAPAPPAPAAPPVAEPPPAPAPPPVTRVPLVGLPSRLAAFAGLGTWVDLYDTELTPTEQVLAAAAGGAQAIFVQTGRFNTPLDVAEPARVAALLEAAHAHGMRVVAWYLPGHVDPERDLRRSLAAVMFTTPNGHRFDAFGLDIEAENLPDVAERTRRLLLLSSALRRAVGPDYPLAAIVLPPLQLDLRTSWWPAFPFAELRQFYDVYIPMSYSSFRGTDATTTYRWNLDNILELRRRTGDPSLPIHLAGGIADRLPELEAFLGAARDGLVVGGSLYDLHTTRPEAWSTLRRLRTTDFPG